MSCQPLVALVYATPATVLDDYARLLDLAGLPGALDAALPLRVVPQLTRHYPFPAANTPPWQLDGVLRALARAGRTRVCVALPRAGLPAQLLGDDLDGLRPIARVHGIDICAGPPAPGEAWLWLPALSSAAPTPAAVLARALAARAGGPPVAAVMDATTVGCGAQPQVRNTLLASADALALLAVVARLGGPPLPQAARPPLGARPAALLGDTALAEQRLHLRGVGAPPAWLGRYRWPAGDRRRFESWLRDTGWGRLFGAYQRRDP